MSLLSKHALTLFALALLTFLAVGCGGGSDSTPPPPPPAAKFSNASLSGQYAFSMSGSELCAGVSSYFARAGSFIADGKGNITSGLEDINVCTGVGTLQFAGGRYSIGADGRGTLKLTNSTGTTNYSVVLSSTAAGSIAQTDADATASGTFQRQNAAAFSNPAIAGGYVFDFNGVDVSGTVVNPSSYIGRFDADGAGTIFNGLFDSNVGGTLSGQQLFPAGAFYQIDTNGDGTTFGRGTANISGQSFVFYIVDATRLKFIGIDFPSASIGEAFAQQNIAFDAGSLTGSFSFLIGGWSSSGAISTAGRFTADGASNISNIVLDENNTGTITLLPSGGVSGSFTVDANQFGGGTITWTDTNVGTFSFIFYLISPTQAVFQETDSVIVSDGSLMSQTTTPISAAALAGDHTVGWTGVSSDEEDFVGQLNLTSSGSLSGNIDLNEFGTGKQFFDVPLIGNLTLSGDGTQANTFDADLQASTAARLHFTTYVVNQNTLLLVGVDSDRVIAGTLTRQP
jgi:hypothetical protein